MLMVCCCQMLIYMDYLTFPVEYIELIRSNPKVL